MTEKKFGILIASSRFPKEPTLQPLRCPGHDVDGLNDILKSPEHGQFSKTFVLRNKLSHEVMGIINRVLQEAGKDDLVLIYYSGHGKLNLAGRLHLATVDTQVKYLDSTSIPVARIKDFVDISPSNQIVIILDCCYSGTVKDAFVRSGVDDQLQLVSGGRGTYILTASTGIQQALEKESDEYGVFTKHVIQGIQSGEADMDEDGLVSMNDLYEYVRVRMPYEGCQEPMRWDLNVRGRPLFIARTKRPSRIIQGDVGITHLVQGNIDIKIDLTDVARWYYGQYEIKGYGVNYLKEGRIVLDGSILNRLASKSERLNDKTSYPGPLWLEGLRSIGEVLRREIIDKHEDLKKDFIEIVELVGGIENTRLRFKISAQEDSPGSALMFDVITNDNNHFLMLLAPISFITIPRTGFSGEYPLFHKAGPGGLINCLIIEADTSGFVPGPLKWKGEPLILGVPNIKPESDWLTDYLANLDGRVNVGKILRIREDTIPTNHTFEAYLGEVLTKDGPWHLVHYVGHSIYDDRNEGYVFLPGPRSPLIIKVNDFCQNLKTAKTRFLYMSGGMVTVSLCHALGSRGIPALIGFRYPLYSIDDYKAFEHAKIFYRALFETKDLSLALLETRRYLYKKYPEDLVWASSMLFMVD